MSNITNCKRVTGFFFSNCDTGQFWDHCEHWLEEYTGLWNYSNVLMNAKAQKWQNQWGFFTWIEKDNSRQWNNSWRQNCLIISEMDTLSCKLFHKTVFFKRQVLPTFPTQAEFPCLWRLNKVFHRTGLFLAFKYLEMAEKVFQ